MANGKITLGKQSGGTLGLVFPDGVSDTEVVLHESGNIASVATVVTDNAIARYDGTTGKLQNSGVVIDDNNRLGIGVVPNENYALDTGTRDGASFALFNVVRSGTGYPAYGYNIRRTGTNGVYNYDRVDSASMVEIGDRTFTWKTAPSGTAGNAIPWTNAMTLAASGNLLLTSGTGALGYGAGAGGTVTQLTSKSTAVTLNKPSGAIYTHNAALAAGASVEFVLNNSLVNIETISVLHNYSGIYDIRLGIDTSGQVRFIIKNISASSQSNTITIYFSIIKGAIT